MVLSRAWTWMTYVPLEGRVTQPLAETPGWDFFVGETPGSDSAILASIPLGRMGQPEADIGRAAVYLASEDAGYVTGTTLMVDGGYNYLR